MRLHEHLMFPSFDSSRSGMTMSLRPSWVNHDLVMSHEDFVSSKMGTQDNSKAHSE